MQVSTELRELQSHGRQHSRGLPRQIHLPIRDRQGWAGRAAGTNEIVVVVGLGVSVHGYSTAHGAVPVSSIRRRFKAFCVEEASRGRSVERECAKGCL